ncbi:uncharacterized protein LOC142537620 [Primulina tabacum]|uniref:uncharacterized protein LOC142537620 n=1 Tax=Primulina tabacum TaxID=48773 RepID=UPI003F592FD2
MQWTTHEQAQAQAIVHRHGPVQTDVYDRFRRLNPPEFMGSTDPAVAEEWIKSLESIFSYLHMEYADKVTCAIFLLTKHARIWWESARVALPVGPLTWGTFKTVFYNKYFSKDVRAKKASDFLNLKQGTMSMTEYIQQFEAGVQYVPYIAQDDTSKGEHFMRGLRSEIKRDVRMSKVATYGEIVEIALMAEQDEQDIDRDRQQRRQQYFQKSQGTGQGKKTDNRGTRPEESRGKGPPRRKEQDRPPCPKCGKLNGGECTQGSNVCYRCKKPGHLAKNCPGSSEKVQGRLFSMTKEEVDADTSMITGKANVVADALSRKSSSITAMQIQEQILWDLQNLKIDVIPKGAVIQLSSIMIRPTLADRIKVEQKTDNELQQLRQRDEEKGNLNFELNWEGIWTYRGRLCVPKQGTIRTDILIDAHATSYSIHPGGTKMEETFLEQSLRNQCAEAEWVAPER